MSLCISRRFSYCRMQCNRCWEIWCGPSNIAYTGRHSISPPKYVAHLNAVLELIQRAG
jgi:hypothetical protein